ATGEDQDDQVFVPLTTLQHRLVGAERVNLIIVSAKSESLIPQAQTAIERALRQRHRLKPDAPADFEVSSVQELTELAVVLTATLQALSAVIASVSLVVGGVGVMNIMLVAVTERTREIGLRMAVGARPVDVLLQFLGEAVVLTLFGGLIGVLIGVGGALGMATALDWPVVVRGEVIALAFAVSAAVGVGFGFYPAWKASRLDPITALRHE
ncbi:MAG TPA: FtsX-like permease family protein, partial [Gemmataceae bacterium]|nr:FtsX-like permease family protein [Gemmataceae bacterium]